MRAVRIHSRHFNGRQPSGLGKNNLTAGRVFFWGVEWGAYARDKIPPQEFALKMQGGLMREGERICGTLRYMSVRILFMLQKRRPKKQQSLLSYL